MVTASVLDNVIVGSPLQSLNNITTSSMSPRDLNLMFNSREARIVPIASVSDLAYHGFTATKNKTVAKTIVIESILPNIVTGSEILSIDGTLTSSMKPSVLSKLLSTRSGRVQPLLREQILVVSDLEYHGFIAAKTHTARPTTIVESISGLYIVGTELSTLNGADLLTITPSQLRRMFSMRTGRLVPSIRPLLDDTAIDAKNYASMLSETAMFGICALCGEEGPPKGSVAVGDCIDLLKGTNIQLLYEEYTNCLAETGLHRTCDVGYAKEIQYYLPDGLLRGEQQICSTCHNRLCKINKLSKDKAPGPEKNTIETNDNNNLPCDSLILGLFPGRIPLELSDLNPIEVSMISIYSSISKVSLHGGKHYSANGAMTYTIVNDITSVANRLPRMPSTDTIAILRYGSGRSCKDYKYRPYFVKRALLWLVANNHLYDSITFDWPVNDNWDDIEAVSEAPFLPLSDSDVRGLDEDEEQSDLRDQNKGGQNNIM